MAIVTETVFKDSESGEHMQLLDCPCGNNVFYVTSSHERICACCKMTGEEFQKDLDAKRGV